MEDKQTIKSLIEPQDYLVSIDLFSAFHSIHLHPDSRKLVSFIFEGVAYSFNVLPFGLTSSPRIFSKLLRPVIAHLRSMGIKITAYLDDILISSPSFNKALSDLNTTVDLLISLGYSINWEKSNCIPSQKILHLGYLWDSTSLSLSLPEDKLVKIKSIAQKCLSSPQSLRTYSALLGLLVSSHNAFQFSPLFYRKFQLCFIDALKCCVSWDEIWCLSPEAMEDLNWWVSSSLSMLTPVSFLPFQSDVELFTDSSSYGWGATLSSGEFISGSWSCEEKSFHINFLELKAVYLAILHFLPILKNKKVSIRSDNSTTVYYINKMGGTHSKSLCLLAISLWSILKENAISCSSSHISGIDNKAADFFSRYSHNHEFGIIQNSFQILKDMIPFSLSLDLFASKYNNKLDNYCSIFDDPNCFRIDAFSFIWPSNVYLFPPIPLIPKSLLKAFRDDVYQCLIITPAWHSLSMIPLLTRSLISNPIFIHSDHMSGCLPTRHRFNLMAWPICASYARTKEFQDQCPRLSSRVLDLEPYSHISETGKILLNGLKEKGIHPICL